MVFGCIFIPDFSVQAIIRQEPDLCGKPIAILQGAPPLTKVFAANQAAKDLGIELGMTKVQAECCGHIEWRWRSLSQEASAQAALFDCAYTVSPRIEQVRNANEADFFDCVVLDLLGCEKLFGSPQKIANHLKNMAAEVDLEPSIAIAGNPQAAVSVARGFSGITLIPSGSEAAYIGGLPLSALALPLELRETLGRWGIHTCAEFAVLPEIAVIERAGQEGRRWQQLCRGGDPSPLIPREPRAQFEECMDLDFPIDLLEPLLFVLNRLLDQLCIRLRMHVLATTELKVKLTLQPENLSKKELLHIRTLRLPVPVSESKFLLKLLQLDLQAHPPSSPVIAISLSAIPTCPRTRQLGLFLPMAPEPEALEITLARIQSVVGEGHIGSPALLDSHRPCAFRQDHFVLPDPSLNNFSADCFPKTALRIFRPPLPATVQLQNEQPRSISFEDRQKPILAFAGPSRTSGEWWSETPWGRDEWDVLVPLSRPEAQPENPFRDPPAKEEQTALYRIYRDLHSDHWFVEGIHD
ncbi:MAG: DNA polymerase Y family protein [Candidatus Acidiferrum sp.]